MTFTYDYPMPAVTVDAVIIRKNNVSEDVLLIKRGREPFKDMWALPGGFIEIDEELENAVKRELFEETGIVHKNLRQLFTVGTVGRDPRYRTISVVYTGLFDEKNMKVCAGDDASEAAWFSITELPEMAFDHKDVIEKAFQLIAVK